MSYYVQKIVNSFPGWSSARKDPSSLLYRYLSTFAESFESEVVNQSRISRVPRLRYDSPFSLSKTYLTEEITIADDLTPVLSSVSATAPSSSTVNAGQTVQLTKAETREDLFYGLPTRFQQESTYTVVNWTLWTGDYSTVPAVTTNSSLPVRLDYPEYLGISVLNSTFYKKFSTKNRLQIEQGPYSGHHKVWIEGKDNLGNEIHESVFIKDDGYYQTLKIFKEITKVEAEGFDGTVTIQISQVNFPRHLNPDMIGATTDFENPLFFELAYPEEGSGSYLNSLTIQKHWGEDYRHFDPVTVNMKLLDDEPDINDELIASQWLLDDQGVSYTAVDFCISAYDSRIYVLDNNNKVHIYNPRLSYNVPADKSAKPSSYTGPELTRTKAVTILIRPMFSRAAFGETMKMWTHHRIVRGPVESVKIYRESPNGSIEYLQSDKTWAAAQYLFAGDFLKMPEDSWSDFSFYNYFDQTGQWNFFCEAVIFPTKEVRRYSTSIFCEQIQADVSIPTNLTSTSGIFFNEKGQLCLKIGNTYTGFHVARDKYLLEYIAAKPVTIGSTGLEDFVSGLLFCFDSYPGGINVAY